MKKLKFDEQVEQFVFKPRRPIMRKFKQVQQVPPRQMKQGSSLCCHCHLQNVSLGYHYFNTHNFYEHRHDAMQQILCRLWKCLKYGTCQQNFKGFPVHVRLRAQQLNSQNGKCFSLGNHLRFIGTFKFKSYLSPQNQFINSRLAEDFQRSSP